MAENKTKETKETKVETPKEEPKTKKVKLLITGDFKNGRVAFSGGKVFPIDKDKVIEVPTEFAKKLVKNKQAEYVTK